MPPKPTTLDRVTFTTSLPADTAREVRSRARKSGLEIGEWIAARITTALERTRPALHDAGVMDDDATDEFDRAELDEMAHEGQLFLALPSTERPTARGGRKDGHNP